MNPQKDAGIQTQGETFLSQTENVELHKKKCVRKNKKQFANQHSAVQ